MSLALFLLPIPATFQSHPSISTHPYSHPPPHPKSPQTPTLQLPSPSQFPSPPASLDRSVLLRLTVALLAGALIGLERRASSATAGVRTLILVALGSAIFTLVAVLALPAGGGDPTRIAASIATGVGFVGSGTINATENSNRGLTTAASIWIAAALGVSAAYGLLGTALMGAVMTVGILRWSKWERYFRRKVWRWERMRIVAERRRVLMELRRRGGGE